MEVVQRQWGRETTGGEQMGRASVFPASRRYSVTMVEGRGIGVRRGRDKGLPRHLCTQPVPVASVHRLPASLGIPTLVG